MNSINLVGRLTKKPEVKYTSNQKAVCEFSLAVNRIGVEGTDFITCQVWNKQAENLEKYQDKGNMIAVVGSLRVDKFQDKDGNDRYKTFVMASNVEYLESKKEAGVKEAPVVEESKEDPYKDFAEEVEILDSDLPF